MHIYPYTYMSEGTECSPWWGVRCPRKFYEDTVRDLEATRCFVYLTNEKGDTLAIAVEGPHTDGDMIFAPDWVFTRLGLEYGDTITVEAILESLPKGNAVLLRPMTGDTVEGPMFLEGLTEALNQLGVVQEGLISAVVDPSMPILHEFMIENLMPARVCLADGELRVDLERALDRPPSPVPIEDTDDTHFIPIEDTNDSHFIPIENTTSRSFVPFSGQGYRLG